MYPFPILFFFYFQYFPTLPVIFRHIHIIIKHFIIIIIFPCHLGTPDAAKNPKFQEDSFDTQDHTINSGNQLLRPANNHHPLLQKLLGRVKNLIYRKRLKVK